MIALRTHNCTMTDPHADPISALEPTPIRWVACLCADWCGTCRDYRPVFDQVAAQHPGHSFIWLDIEDEAALTEDLEIEIFPTVLVGEGGRLLFAGPLLPHAGTLSRMLAGLDGRCAAVDDAGLNRLAAALQARIRSG